MELRSGRRLPATIGFASAMELRSGRRLRSTQQQVRSRPDHISALPDDLLLLILTRLCCAATAARTGVLSSRWRNLWTLLSALVFRDVKSASLEPVLARLESPVVSLLEIHVPDAPPSDPLPITLLLHAAARLEPEQLVFAIPNIAGNVDVPCFRRASSIVLQSNNSISFHMPFGTNFEALDTLTFSCYNIIGFDDLISQCPRLRVLRINGYMEHDLVRVHSPSLQELFVDTIGWTNHVDIVAPALRQLSMSVRPDHQVNLSVSAPLVETISWHSSYYYVSEPIGFGHWSLDELKLKTTEGQPDLHSLHIHATICSFFCSDQVANFRQEIEKYMFVTFSILELHLLTSRHDFGAFVFHLIGMNQIRTTMRRLTVILSKAWVKKPCPANCLCHAMNSGVQNVSLDALEDMQIGGFQGWDHEFDFLELVLNSALMIKQVTVKLSNGHPSSRKVCVELYDLFRAYPSVESHVYDSTGQYMSCIHD